jgi:hypothetical protein
MPVLEIVVKWLALLVKIWRDSDLNLSWEFNSWILGLFNKNSSAPECIALNETGIKLWIGNKYLEEASDPNWRQLYIICLEILKKSRKNSVGTYCNSDKIQIIFLPIMWYVCNITSTLRMAIHSGRRATRLSSITGNLWLYREESYELFDYE